MAITPTQTRVFLDENLQGLRIENTGQLISRKQIKENEELKKVYKNLLKKSYAAREKVRLSIDVEDKPFWQKFTETTAKFGEAISVPGVDIAKGYVSRHKFKKEEKRLEEAWKDERRLQEEIVEKLRKTTDPKKRKHLRSALKNFKYSSSEGMEAILEDAPTQRQIIFDAAEASLLAGLGYKPYLGSGKLVRGAKLKGLTQAYKYEKGLRAAKALKKAGLVKKALTRFAKPVAKQAIIGGAFFGTMKAQEKDANINDIVKSVEIGAMIGGGVTIASQFLGAGIRTLQKYVKPKFSKGWQKMMMKMEKAAFEARKTKGTKQIDKTLSYVGQSLKQRATAGMLRGIRGVSKWKTGLIDKFSPLQRVESRILAVKGGKLSQSERIYRDFRIANPIADAKAEALVGGYADDLSKVSPQVRQKAKAYLAQLSWLDEIKLGHKVSGGQSLDDLLRSLGKLKAEIGPDDMKKVIRVKNIVNQYNRKLLDQRVGAGILSRGARDAMLRAHPNYVPHNVIMALDERTTIGISSSMNMAKSDIMKAVGSIRKIDDPLVATLQRTPLATRAMEKNKLLRKFVRAQEKYNIFPGMKKIAKGVSPAKGFDTINLFRKGAGQTWQVPKDIAVAIKQTESVQSPWFWRLLSKPTKVLKKGATQYNLSFAIPNKFRDVQTATLTSGSFIDDIARHTKLTRKALDLSNKQIRNIYKLNGGYGASVFREARGENALFKKLMKRRVAEKLAYTNPAKLINKINSEVEISTRLSVFKRALSKGLHPRDAAMIARDASIDFARMGNWIKPLNEVIPFLNPRIQGFANIPRAIAANPETFARMQLYTAVYPTLALHKYNRRFNSYKNISQYFKNRYWCIMIGETESIDPYTGKRIAVPQFITLPKGEGQILVSSPIQYYLEKSDEIDYRKTSEMLVDTIGSASPLEFQSFDQGNGWLTGISQLGPLATVPVGWGTNVHPYFGTKIVPESREGVEPELQTKYSTSEIARVAGKILNLSPAKIEFAINGFGAGVSKDIQLALDKAIGIIREGEIANKSLSQTELGALKDNPILRRFVRESNELYSPEMQRRREKKEEIEVDIRSQKTRIKDKAEDIWREMNQKKTAEDKLNFLNSLGSELTPEITKQLFSIKNFRSSVDILTPNTSTLLRARYISWRLSDMKERGIDEEERLNYLEKLQEDKILTTKVFTIMKLLQQR